MEKFNQIEKGIILSSLGARFNNISQKLESPEKLGDIEKELLETEKERLLPVIMKMEKEVDFGH